MKAAIVTDTHFGARGDSQAFDDFFKKFYTNCFWPKIDELGIKTIFHLGDCFDRRKYINFNTLKSCREYFFNEAKSRDITIVMIVGNHDTFFKNTNSVNSPYLLLNDYDNILTFHNASEFLWGDRAILLMPWLCTDNYEHSLQAIKDTKAEVCFGHLELAGYQMYKGIESDDGHDPKIFEKFKLVCTGHFHHRHTRGNISYLGNPYEMFWNDYADDRGFHVFDSETLDLEFIRNPHTIFEKLYYDDTKTLPNVEDYKDKMVKLIVVNKEDNYSYEQYLDKLYKHNPIEVKIIEDFSEFESSVMDETNVDLSDTLTLLSQYVDALETDIDKEKLKVVMKTLYVEAQDFEEQ